MQELTIRMKKNEFPCFYLVEHVFQRQSTRARVTIAQIVAEQTIHACGRSRIPSKPLCLISRRGFG